MSARPGPLNLLTDVEGLSVGQAEDVAVRTGCTVVLADRPAVAAVDVRGGGPGTRETDLLAADTLVEAVDGVALSGGSVYGLAVGDGVAAWLGAQGRGFRFRSTDVTAPIVPGAILFDLANGGDKAWGEDPPYRRLGREAAASAGSRFTLGTAGAGYGPMAGTLKGGVGSASFVTTGGYTVGALAAVNSFGSVVAPGGAAFWAGAHEVGNEFGGLGPPGKVVAGEDWGLAKVQAAPRENTTLAVVATDAILTPAQARRLAVMAQNGLSRAIRPVHTPFDGDVVFALSTGRRPLAEPADLTLLRLGALAADTLARAVARGVYAATPWPGVQVPVWSDLARPHGSD
jgi:L-aminopeptidase/D-esterase-like protein